MKVVVVAPYFYPRVGGVEVYTLNIARQLAEIGWEVVIITTGVRRSGSPEYLDGMRIYRLKTALTVSNTPIGLCWRRQLKRIFRAEQPDLINAHTPVPYLADIAQRSAGSIPVVLTYHNDLDKDSLLAKIVVRLAHFAIIRRTLSGSARIIATSEFYVRDSKYLEPHRAKIRIVSPGVDVRRFHPGVQVGTELAERFADTRVILFVGSVNKALQHKGLDVLINAFARINAETANTRLVVVGTGDGTGIYKSLAFSARIAEKVVFTGYVSDDELAQYYRLATVLALPSTNRSEGFGMVYIEAGAVGIPVVGCKVGGVPYAVTDNETGLLAEPNSVESLHGALRRILDDHSLAQRLGAAGAERAAAQFGWRLLGERTDRIFREMSKSTTPY